MVYAMMDPETAYFLKKYYPHVIKWWLVMYNPEVIRIWPSEEEKEETLRLEAEEAERLALEPPEDENSDAFNAATGSYSGLYGQGPVDASTQAALNAIMNTTSNQNNIDSLFSGGELTTGAAYAYSGSNSTSSPDDVILPPEQDAIIEEANAIYERLLREAAEDEAKKQAEIDKARQVYDEQQA